MAGKFIILEGGEGAGKSTLARNLEREFKKTGTSVIRTREPGGTPWAEKIRSLLIEKDETIDHQMSPVAQLLGYYAARFEHLERIIVPALQEGKIVIGDRFELSTYSYQVHTLGDDRLEALFKVLHAHVAERLKPFECIYLYCDIAPKVGLARVEARGEKKTFFDSQSLDFHQRVREGMVYGQKKINPHFTCVTLDASLNEEDLLTAAKNTLRF